MKPIPTRLATLLALSAVLVSVLVGACGGDDGGSIQEPTPVAVVTISAPTTMIRVGGTVQLTASAQDADGNVLEGRDFTWTSGIRTVASVSPSGLVTGLVKGQSEIRATTDGVTGTLVITVAVRPNPEQRTAYDQRHRRPHAVEAGELVNSKPPPRVGLPAADLQPKAELQPKA
jgi:hypothetical protein